MRVIYMGTPQFAVPAFRTLMEAGHEIAAVYTQPPRAAGRGMSLRKSPVHQVAEEAGSPVETPETLKSETAQARFAAYEAEIAVVAAYGLILPQRVLDAPAQGCLNLHASLLPRWRGAAPIHRAVMAGDAESGVTVMRIEAGLDTGPMCLSERVAIRPEMTAGELHDALAHIAGELARRALDLTQRGELLCSPQPEERATYAPKIGGEETRIDWSRPAMEVHNLIRGLSPSPGAWSEMESSGKRERVKVLRSRIADGRGSPGELLEGGFRVACGAGAVELSEVQRAGKRPCSGQEALRGLKPTNHARLS